MLCFVLNKQRYLEAFMCFDLISFAPVIQSHEAADFVVVGCCCCCPPTPPPPSPCPSPLPVHQLGGYSKTRYKKLLTHVESHASAVSLLESGE